MNANTLIIESAVGTTQPQKKSPSAEQLREFERRAREARKQAQLAANQSVRAGYGKDNDLNADFREAKLCNVSG